MNFIDASSLGSHEFKNDYKLKFAYTAGSMYKGISSVKLVTKMAKAGFLSFFGTGGLNINTIEIAIKNLKAQLGETCSYGMNLLHHITDSEIEQHLVNLFIKHNIYTIEAAAYLQMNKSIVLYRVKGLHRLTDGSIMIPHRVIAKISHPEVAKKFMQPAPYPIIYQLKEANLITEEEAILSQQIPMSHDICVESDSGGHTDQGIALTLLPVILKERDKVMSEYQYSKSIRVGAAGGIGTPEAVAAAFILGADFITTGSINQCTIEAETSESAKSLLQVIEVKDTAYAPAGDRFETGAKVQVVNKSTFFPSRANHLYEIYKRYHSLDEVDIKIKKHIEEKYFNKSIDEVWQETCEYYLKIRPEEIEKSINNPKHKMALIFKWYFIHSARLAKIGDETQKINFQIHTGPALGAFNQWVKGTELESWQNRSVNNIAEKLMEESARLLSLRCCNWLESYNKIVQLN